MLHMFGSIIHTLLYGPFAFVRSGAEEIVKTLESPTFALLDTKIGRQILLAGSTYDMNDWLL